MNVIEKLDSLTKPKPKKVKTTTSPGYGYMVSYELHLPDKKLLLSKHFPDLHTNEPLIRYEADAWEIAEYLAKNAKDNIVNVYVIDHNFVPTKYPKKFNQYPL